MAEEYEYEINVRSVVELRYIQMPLQGDWATKVEKDCGHVLSIIRGGAEGEESPAIYSMVVRPVVDWEHRNYEDDDEENTPLGAITLTKVAQVARQILGVVGDTLLFLDESNSRLVLVDTTRGEAETMYRVEDSVCEIVGNEEPVICVGADEAINFLIGEVNALRWALRG